MVFSHIIWTTYSTWLPHEKRGKWNSLAKIYNSLPNDFKIEYSKPLYQSYSNKAHNNEKVVFSESDISCIKESIYELSSSDGDRIAGGLNILALHVNPTEVQMLINGSFNENKQKISRLKSRTATLLNYNNDLESNNSAKHTWSKGIWHSQFSENEMSFIISSYINEKNTYKQVKLIRSRSLGPKQGDIHDF